MTVLIVVILPTLVLSLVFARVFQKIPPIATTNDPVPTNTEILKSLEEGSDLEVKEAIADPRIKVSVIQMQHLGLPRVERRKRNTSLALSLADTQAKSFIVMKQRISKETCMQIIEDFMHRPSRMDNLKEAKEDLVRLIKKKYGRPITFTIT